MVSPGLRIRTLADFWTEKHFSNTVENYIPDEEMSDFLIHLYVEMVELKLKKKLNFLNY
jgi:hypothetical protein